MEESVKLRRDSALRITTGSFYLVFDYQWRYPS
jgi:hypothetical protein